MNERDVFFKVEKRLIQLGHSKDSIQFEVKTPLGRRADVVVFQGDKAKIVIEIQNISVLLPETDSELKFHPATRQAQAYAKELGAPYFAITNGSVYRWFTTADDGRPKLIPYPVLTGPSSTEDTSLGKNKILHILFDLADQSRTSLSLDSLLLNLGVALLSYLTPNESSHILNGTRDFEFLEASRIDRDFLENALSTFTDVDIKSYSGTVLVEAIDEFLQAYLTDRRFSQFKLPTWLTQFMLELAEIQTSKRFLDIYSNLGDGVTAAHAISKNTSIYSASFTGFSFLWDLVKRGALGINKKDALFAAPDAINEISLPANIDRVLVAPPFGGRVVIDGRAQRSEIVFLEKAIDVIEHTGFVVAIVPESFLFAEGAEKRLRFKILEACRVWAIISLEQFLPNSGIKANILVLEKQTTRTLGQVLMAELKSTDIKQISSNNSIKKLKEILDVYHKQLLGQETSATEQITLVPEQELFSEKSWVVRRYLYEISDEDDVIAYPTQSLSDLCSISKGAKIRLAEEVGDLPVIGPAAVRALYIDPIKLNKTSKEEIALAKISPRYVQPNDILIHAIGPHRGEAALVTHDFAGILVSQHMLILSPRSQEVIPEYLAIALNSSFVRKQIYNVSTGSVIAGLTAGNARNLVIPVPPVAEQEKIIHKVRSIQSKLTQIENNLKETEGELETILDNFYTLGVNNNE